MASRAHIVVPEDLLAEVDRIAGPRRRSQFVQAAIREKLDHAAQSEALRASAGVIDPAEYAEWTTPEATSAWVRSLRRADDDRLERQQTVETTASASL